MPKDYYKTLELSKTATQQEIKTAYRRLARKYHPDYNPGNKQSEEVFKEVGEAYEVLGDEDKRRKYDMFGQDWEKYDKAGYTTRDASSGYGFDYNNYKKDNTGSQGFSDIFENIFGTKTRGGSRANVQFNNSSPAGNSTTSSDFGFARGATTAKPQRGEDREQPLDLSLEEAFNAASRQLQLQSNDPCSGCRGTGIRSGQRCSVCAGLGVVPRSKRLEVRIPAGVEEGSRVRVAGEGGAGLNGGQNGDLFLKIHVLPHPVFERKGPDLYTTVPVPLYTSILGGELIVPSLKGGKFGLNVPPDTQNGKVFRLASQGMPVLNQPGTRGDLYVKVEIVLPSNLSEDEKALFRRLRELRPF